MLAVAVCVVVWPVLRLHDPPIYRHDWHWPLLRETFASVPSFSTSAWLPQNVGSPTVPYATNLMLVLIEAALGMVLGAKASLDVLLVILGAAAACGAAHLCATLRGRWDAPAMALAGATYVAAPVFSDELVAGHIDDLAAVAAFPWLVVGLVSYSRAPHVRTLAMIAIAAGCCAMQVQYVVLIMVPVVWTVAAFRSRSALVAGCAAMCFMLAVNAPTLYQIARTHANAAVLQNDRAVIGDEIWESAALVPALVGGGYAPGYDRGDNPSTAPFFDLLALGAPLCLLVWAYRERRDRPAGLLLAGIYTTGVVTIAGLEGPAAMLWRWLFENVAATSLMRELFHAAPLVALPLSVIVGLLASDRRLIVVALVLFVALDRWSLGGGAGAWLTSHPMAPDVQAFVDQIAHAPGDGRVAITPGHQPVSEGVDGSVGEDALEFYPIGKHWTLFEYVPTAGINALVSDLLMRGPGPHTNAILERMSVDVMLARLAPGADVAGGVMRWPGSERAPVLIHLHPRPLVYGAAPPLLTGGDLSELFAHRDANDVLALMRQQPAFLETGSPYRLGRAGTDDRMLAEGCAWFGEIAPSRVSTDPRDAWVLARRFGSVDPAFDYAVSNAILTVSTTPPPLANVPRNARILAAVLDERGGSYRWTDAVPHQLALGQVVVVAGFLDRTPGACRTLAPPPAPATARVQVETFERSSSVSLRGILRVASGAGTLVFTDAYDPDWQLFLDGEAVPENRHFVADGFANGWVLTGDAAPRRFAIVYAPAAAFNALTALSVILWATAVLAFVVVRRK